jgi:hypothetical protein
VISEPQAGHFTERQMAARGNGAEHWGQVTATQAIKTLLLVQTLWAHWSSCCD